MRLVNPRSAMAMRQAGACERDNRYGGYNGEYARGRSPAHRFCCRQYWTLHLELSRRTHYATIIRYAVRMSELAVDREAIAYHGKRLEYFTIARAQEECLPPRRRLPERFQGSHDVVLSLTSFN